MSGVKHIKLDLYERLAATNDPLILQQLLEVFNKLIPVENTDFWDEISDAEKKGITIGLEQIKNGETIPHEQVMKNRK